VRACSGWMRRQRGGGGRRGPTCLYAPLRARPMPTPPRARTASSPDPSQGRTDRDASSSSPAGPARPATTCSRCLAWRAAPCSAPLQVGPRAAALPLRPSPCRAPSLLVLGYYLSFRALQSPVFGSVPLLYSSSRDSVADCDTSCY
jgi:hypothetical protein